MSDDMLARLVAWRGALCRALDAFSAGVAPESADLGAINCKDNPATRIRSINAAMEIEEVILADDPVARLSALCVDELSRCDRRRIKTCARSQCAMYFYDQTRNRSARWHAEDPCGWRSRDERRRAGPQRA